MVHFAYFTLADNIETQQIFIYKYIKLVTYSIHFVIIAIRITCYGDDPCLTQINSTIALPSTLNWISLRSGLLTNLGSMRGPPFKSTVLSEYSKKKHLVLLSTLSKNIVSLRRTWHLAKLVLGNKSANRPRENPRNQEIRDWLTNLLDGLLAVAAGDGVRQQQRRRLTLCRTARRNGNFYFDFKCARKYRTFLLNSGNKCNSIL